MHIATVKPWLGTEPAPLSSCSFQIISSFSTFQIISHARTTWWAIIKVVLIKDNETFNFFLFEILHTKGNSSKKHNTIWIKRQKKQITAQYNWSNVRKLFKIVDTQKECQGKCIDFGLPISFKLFRKLFDFSQFLCILAFYCAGYDLTSTWLMSAIPGHMLVLQVWLWTPNPKPF